MFIIRFYANDLLLEKVEAVNTGRKDERGYSQYRILPEYAGGYVYHDSDNGAMELARLLLNKILAKGE